MLKLALALLALAVTAAPAHAALVDERVAFSVDAVKDGTGAIAVGDVDGNGHGDAVIDEDEGRRFHLVLAGGRGTFRIRGIVNEPPLPAGDVNGDGIGDLAIPTVEITRRGVLVAVVLGRRTWQDVNLGRRADRDIVIRVRQQTPGIGQNDASVTAAGDMNGDGIGDLALTAASFDSLDRSGAPARMWVMFGRRGLRGSFDASRLGSGGFAIQGGPTHVGLGAPLAPAGDVDGDGLADLLVGAPYSNPRGVTNHTFEQARGRAFVVYGRRDGGAVVDLRRPAGVATEIATNRLAKLGAALAGPGDMNGDGLADVAVGAPGRAPSPTGTAYVLAGQRFRPPRVDVTSDAAAGALLRMSGVTPDDQLGSVIVAPGDVDGDHRADLLLLAPRSRRSDPPLIAQQAPDELYLVHGGRTPEAFAPASVGTGVTVISAASDQAIGGAIAAGTDLDADGLTELLVPLTSCGGSDTRIVALELSGPVPGLPAGYGTAAADLLRGGTGDDRLVGLDGDDVLEGLAGSDCLIGGPGADRLSGGARRDTLFGDQDDDVLAGGDGIDVLHGGDGDDVLALGAGTGSRGPGWEQVASGGRGNDALTGSAVPDSLRGEDGDDRLTAGAGQDSLDGGSGRDVLDGGPGRDFLDGGPGPDVLKGGPGNDNLHGSFGRDVLDGGPGPDQISANDADRDVVRCGPGKDEALVDRRDTVSGCETVKRATRADR